MVSAIDPSKPADNVPASKADLRANALAAKNEIEAQQAVTEAFSTALGIALGANQFPVLGGNAPATPGNLLAILNAFNAAITSAAQTGGAGGGATTLAGITDILSPNSDVRAAFQEDISAATEANDFAFNLATHGGRLVTMDTATDSVDVLLPDPATIAREDGFLMRLVPTSGVNFASVTGPSGTLRYQGQRLGPSITQTTVFIGLSRASGFRSYVDVIKDGPLYSIVGPARTSETDDLRFNADGIVTANMLAAALLSAAAFPASLDLGGSKIAGGARALQIDVPGTRTLAQTDSGKTLICLSNSDVTWNVPALAAGTQIEVETDGTGSITYNDTAGQAIRGGLLQAPGTTVVLKWLTTGRLVILGTA